jgi:hypothetical protein
MNGSCMINRLKQHFIPLLIWLCSCAIAGCGNRTTLSSPIPSSNRGIADTAQSVRAMTSLSTYPAVVLADRPLAYYRLNDSGLIMVDSASNHLNGAYGPHVKQSGEALTSDSAARSSHFPGSPAGSDIPSNTATVATNPMFAVAANSLTVEAWIKPAAMNNTNNFLALVSYGREAQGQAWALQISPQSTLDFWFKTMGRTASSYWVKSGTILSPSNEYHVVATYDGARASIYVNGRLEASITAAGSLVYAGLSPQFGLSIGGAVGGVRPIYNGAMSDVAVYPSALSASNIQNHYVAGKVPLVSPTPTPAPNSYTSLVEASHPLAYYKLNDAGTTMTDSGTHHLNGAYGTTVRHGSVALTSTQDKSSNFSGNPAGSDIASNAGTVAADKLFETPSTSLTVEAWIKPADFNRTNSFIPIFSYGRGVTGSAWVLQMTPQSSLDFFMKVNGGAGYYELKPAFATLIPSQVHFVAATYDGARAKLYLNGGLVASLPASNTLNYASSGAPYGLAIGGALGSSRPIFNGSISDAAIYAAALSPEVILAHYFTGRIAEPTVETPISSNAFVDSIGVNTHVGFSSTPYTDSWPTFYRLISASGIRHIRDAFVPVPTWYSQRMNALAQAGIRASLIARSTQASQDIAAEIPLFATSMEAIEGPNEPDIFGGPNWAKNTRNFQRLLWSTVKNNPAFAHLRVVGPALIGEGDEVALGDLSAFMDSGSIHDYFSGFNPGTPGWGGLSKYGMYGSISWDVNRAAVVSGTKPIVSGETGYSSSTAAAGGVQGRTGVDSRTLARYVPRVFLEHFIHGIHGTFIYEFYDEPGITGDFDQFGLVGLDNKPKSSYVAVQSLIHVLADPGCKFFPKPLSYVLGGNVNNVHHLLLQQCNGTYQLVIWVETESYDPITKKDIAVAPQQVTLQLAKLPTAASIATIGDDGNLTTNSLAFKGQVATLSLDDHVTIVSFK